MYKVSCNLIFFPTLIFRKFDFLPQNFSPLPLFLYDLVLFLELAVLFVIYDLVILLELVVRFLLYDIKVFQELAVLFVLYDLDTFLKLAVLFVLYDLVIFFVLVVLFVLYDLVIFLELVVLFVLYDLIPLKYTFEPPPSGRRTRSPTLNDIGKWPPDLFLNILCNLKIMISVFISPGAKTIV